MNLADAIRNTPPAMEAAEAGDFEACSAAMAAVNIPVVDGTSWTYETIADRLGADPTERTTLRAQLADVVRLVGMRLEKRSTAESDPAIAEQYQLKAVAIKDAHRLLQAGGLRLDLPDRQATLDLMIDGLTSTGNTVEAALLGRVKLLGVRTESAAQRYLFPSSTVTPEACQAAWLSASVLDVFDAKAAVIRERLRANEITTMSQVVAILEGGA